MNVKKMLPAVLLAMPWAFGVLWLDFSFGWAWQYAAALVTMAALSWLCCKSWKPGVAVAGNLIGFALSGILLTLFRFTELNWYFKPFTALGWAAVLMLFSGGLQWLVWKKQWLLLALAAGFVGTAIGLLYSLQPTT